MFRLVMACFVLALCICCRLPEADYGKNKNKEVDLPNQTADTISVIYSEGGMIKLELSAPEVIMKNNVEEQINEFPKGVQIKFYDQKGSPTANLTAQKGVDDIRKRIRKVYDSVTIISQKDGLIYSTSELIMDEGKDSIYNEGKYVKITKPDGTLLQGYGFNSNTRMDYIKINNLFNSSLAVEEPINQTNEQRPKTQNNLE